VGHAWPQLPQFLASVDVLVQVDVPQSVFGLAQGTLQVPLVHVCGLVQAWPQLPQF